MAIVGGRAYTPQQIRDAENEAMTVCAIPESRLIATAASAVTAEICGRFPGAETKGLRAAVLVGRGNNGADGWMTAAGLLRNGWSVDVIRTSEAGGSAGCAEAYETFLEESKQSSGNTHSVATLSDAVAWDSYDVIVDAVFGIGLNRDVSGEVASVFSEINAKRGRAYVVSVDVPSGIDALTGAVLGAAVRADCTVTFSAKKTGLVLYPGRDYAGTCVVTDAGIPARCFREEGYAVLETAPILPKRARDGHKGIFGKILIIAGSANGPGACILAAKACYRSGAGIVKAVAPEVVLPELLRFAPETVFCGRKRYFSRIAEEQAGYDVRLIGPGLGTDAEASELLASVLGGSDDTVTVFDADALNLLAKLLSDGTPEQRIRQLAAMLPKQSILTPHPAELSRLLGVKVGEVSAKRLDFAKLWISLCDIVLVMKDACTIVAGDGKLVFNATGNDGMGTAGSGDVLAGIASALANFALRGTATPAECAAFAVALHGTAGDIAASEIGRVSLTAGDIIRYLPRALGAPSAIEKGTDD